LPPGPLHRFGRPWALDVPAGGGRLVPKQRPRSAASRRDRRRPSTCRWGSDSRPTAAGAAHQGEWAAQSPASSRCGRRLRRRRRIAVRRDSIRRTRLFPR
jgi:hypothetical protein